MFARIEMYLLSTKKFELKKKVAEFILPVGRIYIYWVDFISSDGATFPTAELALKKLEKIKKIVEA